MCVRGRGGRRGLAVLCSGEREQTTAASRLVEACPSQRRPQDAGDQHVRTQSLLRVTATRMPRDTISRGCFLPVRLRPLLLAACCRRAPAGRLAEAARPRRFRLARGRSLVQPSAATTTSRTAAAAAIAYAPTAVSPSSSSTAAVSRISSAANTRTARMITATRHDARPSPRKAVARKAAHCARHASLFRIRSACGRRNGANRARDPRYRRPIPRSSIRDNASVSPTPHMTRHQDRRIRPCRARSVPE